MNIFGLHEEPTAVGFYRVHQPLLALRKLPRVKISTIEFKYGQHNPSLPLEWYRAQGQWADILFFQRVDNSTNLSLLLTLQEVCKKPLIIDVDDYILDVKSDNPARQFFQPNSDQIKYALMLVNQADAITTTNRHLKEFYKKWNSNIYVLPNCMNLTMFKKPKKKFKRLRIGWAGAQAHHHDLLLIKPYISKILKEHKDIEFHTFGWEAPWVAKLPRHKHHNWVPLEKYYAKLGAVGFDIGLAPLQDSHWNRGKSNLRYLEYSALKIPTIASNVAPYKDTIKDFHNGLIVKKPEQWYYYLKMLIDEPKLRKNLATNAYKLVKVEYNINLMNKQYLKVFNKVLRSQTYDLLPRRSCRSTARS